MAKGGIAARCSRRGTLTRPSASCLDREPLIGAVRGVALGMGLSMALACDFIIAGENSLRMGCVQRKIGLSPDAGNVWFLSRLVGVARTKELVFSRAHGRRGGSPAAGIGEQSRGQRQHHGRGAGDWPPRFADAPSLGLAAAKKMCDRAAAMRPGGVHGNGGSLCRSSRSGRFQGGHRAFRRSGARSSSKLMLKTHSTVGACGWRDGGRWKDLRATSYVGSVLAAWRYELRSHWHSLRLWRSGGPRSAD